MYQFAVFVHLLAAIIWVGGMVFLALVLVPVTRRLQQPPGFSAQVLSMAARRFRLVGWVSLGLLVTSGIWLLTERGIGLPTLFQPEGNTAQILRIKLLLVVVVLVLSALHDFVLGPALARTLVQLRTAGIPAERVARDRRLASWIARVNLLVALGVIGVGVLLSRGV